MRLGLPLKKNNRHLDIDGRIEIVDLLESFFFWASFEHLGLKRSGFQKAFQQKAFRQKSFRQKSYSIMLGVYLCGLPSLLWASQNTHRIEGTKSQHNEPWAVDPNIQAWAHRVAPMESDTERAIAIYRGILAFIRRKQLVPDKNNEPKARPPKTAREVFAIAQSADKLSADARAVGCYEFSLLYVAAARALGLHAIGGERIAIDKSGQIGHIVALADTGAGWQVFDLQNGRRGPAGSDYHQLDDAHFEAHHHSHRAVAAFLHDRPKLAQNAIEEALLLAPNQANFLNNRATLWVAQEEWALAQADMLEVVRLAPWVPVYRYQLGRISLMHEAGDIGVGLAQLRLAIDLFPEYGLAWRDLGWALLLDGSVSAGMAALEEAVVRRDTTPYVLEFALLGAMAAHNLPQVRHYVARISQERNLQADHASGHWIAQVKDWLKNPTQQTWIALQKDAEPGAKKWPPPFIQAQLLAMMKR